MKQFKVIVTCGPYDAPCIYTETANANDAIANAKLQSRLGDFQNWIFLPKEIITKKSKFN